MMISEPTHTPEFIKVRHRGRSLIGRNNTFLVTDRSARILVFKRNTGGRFRYLVTDSERRRRDVSNIIASRILSDVFGANSIIYREAVLVFPEGERLPGVVCDYIHDLRRLSEVAPGEVANSEQALLQVVLLAWMGDVDRIENPANDCVDPEGRFVSLDFDFCFSEGVSFLGLPKASRLAVERFITSDAIGASIGAITSLSNKEIEGMVDRVGRAWVSDWNSQYKHSFADVLIRNRQRLSDTRVFSIGVRSLRSWRRDFVARHIFTLNIPGKLFRLVSAQGLWPTFRELLRSIRRAMRQAGSLSSGPTVVRLDADISGTRS